MKTADNGDVLLLGVQKSAVEVKASMDFTASWAVFFDNAMDEVLLTASLGLTAEASTVAVGLEPLTPIETGNGADAIIGIAHASTTVSANATVSLALLIEAVNSSNIHSTLVASVFAQAIASATAIGIDNSTYISTGNGNDFIVGEATANGVADAIANAFADVVTHSDGTGSIDSFVFTNLLSQTAVHATAIGIKGGEYHLGNGSDTVIARASGVGVNMGVQDVLINGGKGHDTFDLQNGTGTIIGGKGQDLLILEGSLSDYTFTEFEGRLGVTIQNSLSFTNLFVSEVEKFQFAADVGMTYHFTDLSLV